MALTLSAKNETQYQPCPAGSYHATCIRIIDLGTQKSEFNGEVKMQPKILVTWEIDPQGDPTLLMSDGRPFTVSRRYTASMHSKSQLSADLKSWRGKDFTPEERESFDLRAILGKPCLLSITHEQSKDGSTIYANIGGIANRIRGYEAPKPHNDIFSFDLAAPDWTKYDQLHERIKEQIQASPEYAELHQPPAPPTAKPTQEVNPPAQEVKPVEDIDDSIPF